MSNSNPLLETEGLPRFSAITPAHVEPAVDAVLADYRARVDALLASVGPRDFSAVVLAGEVLEERLNRAWAPVSHLHGVKDLGGCVRGVHLAAQEKIVEPRERARTEPASFSAGFPRGGRCRRFFRAVTRRTHAGRA